MYICLPMYVLYTQYPFSVFIWLVNVIKKKKKKNKRATSFSLKILKIEVENLYKYITHPPARWSIENNIK